MRYETGLPSSVIRFRTLRGGFYDGLVVGEVYAPVDVTSTGVSMLAPTASTVTSLPASEAQQFIAVGSSFLPPVPPPARILSTSAPLILDTYSPARLMLKGQLAPEVLKLIPLRSVSLKMRMSPVPLSRRQTLDPDRTLASGKLSGSRCVLAAFHAHFTREKSTVRVSGFADCLLLAWAVFVPIGLDDMESMQSCGVRDEPTSPLRSRRLETPQLCMLSTPHVKWGNEPPRLLRIHFFVDREQKSLVIGHCGDHLDTYGTRRRK